ncbi:MAG: methyltransferase [Planctomycetes bacterium]|nr:methyltransferase [Planctomycetota bacterium]
MPRQSLRRFTARGASVVLATPPGVHPPDGYAPLEAACMEFPAGARVLDLGCGSGVFGLWAARAGAGAVWLVDVDPAAVACARENARRNRLAHVRFATGDFFEPCGRERFDVIIGNVPQTPAPRDFSTAKWGGSDGTAHLRRLAREAPAHLAPGGRVYFVLIDLTHADRALEAFARRFVVRCRLRLRRTFTPAEYDARLPGLWSYMERLRAKGWVRYRQQGRKYSFGVRLMEARLRPPAGRARPPRGTR